MRRTVTQHVFHPFFQQQVRFVIVKRLNNVETITEKLIEGKE